MLWMGLPCLVAHFENQNPSPFYFSKLFFSKNRGIYMTVKFMNKMISTNGEKTHFEDSIIIFNSVRDQVMQACVWKKKGSSSLDITDLAEAWGGITESHLETWGEFVFVGICVHCSFILLWRRLSSWLGQQENPQISFGEDKFSMQSQSQLLLTTDYSNHWAALQQLTLLIGKNSRMGSVGSKTGSGSPTFPPLGISHAARHAGPSDSLSHCLF